MMTFAAAAAALSAARRHWPAALVGLALLFAAASHIGRLQAQRALALCRGEAAVARLLIERASQAASALRRETERRDIEQARLLREARRTNVSEESRIGRLRRSAAAPAVGACTVSEALREAEGRL